MIRRLCSRDSDFKAAVMLLEKRCLNSGYKPTMVKEILSQAPSLERSLTYQPRNVNNEIKIIRLIILSGTVYES